MKVKEFQDKLKKEKIEGALFYNVDFELSDPNLVYFAQYSGIGVLFIPYLLAYYLAQFYFKAYRRGYFSVWHFAYLLLAANLIQVYRDGLTSIVVFVFANMMPLALIVILHIIAPLRPNRVEKFTKLPSLATNRSRRTTSG